HIFYYSVFKCCLKYTKWYSTDFAQYSVLCSPGCTENLIGNFLDKANSLICMVFESKGSSKPQSIKKPLLNSFWFFNKDEMLNFCQSFSFGFPNVISISFVILSLSKNFKLTFFKFS